MPRLACHFPSILAGFLLLVASVGCEPVAHLAWSPDGARAAYFAPMSGKLLPGASFLIDPAGKVTADLGPTFGSFAWSKDSTTIFFGAYDNQPPGTDTSVRRWLVDAEDKPLSESPPSDDYPPMALMRWRDGNAEKLASIGHRYVVFVQLSPDEQWLAAITFAREPGRDGQAELFVYSMASKKLYEVSDDCGNGLCFTGPGRLAYVESDRAKGGSALTTGQIVEVKLDDASEQIERTSLVDVLPNRTTYLQSTDDGLLFTTMPRAFPVRSSKENAERPPGLYHYTRANGGITAMAESSADLFSASPDNKRILYFKVTPATDKMPAKRELAVMNANGSDEHILRDVSGQGDVPAMWPAWHGNEEITFISPSAQDLPVQQAKEPRVAFDVVMYKLTPQGTLEGGKVLSEGWPTGMKPSMKKANYRSPAQP